MKGLMNGNSAHNGASTNGASVNNGASTNGASAANGQLASGSVKRAKAPAIRKHVGI